jgi:putative lipoic acid-binding regulatory protein
MSEESLIEFPCDFPIKMMGRDTPGFRATARSLIENHVGPVDENAIRANLSGKGNFVSLTVTVTATSQQQLDDIYRDVSGHDDVLMAL